jgi:hypothetical protein
MMKIFTVLLILALAAGIGTVSALPTGWAGNHGIPYTSGDRGGGDDSGDCQIKELFPSQYCTAWCGQSNGTRDIFFGLFKEPAPLHANAVCPIMQNGFEGICRSHIREFDLYYNGEYIGWYGSNGKLL